MNDTTKPVATKVPAGLTERIRRVRDALLTGLVERDDAIRLALIAALAGEHMLMLGPPGTAKSLIARRLQLAFDEATYFERLLTRFTVPEELFGPLSIKGLEQDRYERLTASYLPTASIAFLDEIFKANSAILNALLTLLNEREFDNGTKRERTPLIAVIGASNELPEGEELGALYDRFLLRLHVGPVTKTGFRDLLRLRGHAEPEIAPGDRLTAADLEAVSSVASSVEVPEDVEALLCDLRDWCIAEGIEVSDRRWRKVVKLLQVSALSNGRDAVSVWDCWLVQHCVWDDPEHREKVYEWYSARVGASAAMDPSRLTKIVVSWEARLKRDQEDRSVMRDDEGRPLYRNAAGEFTTESSGLAQARRNAEPLYLAPDQAQKRNGNGYWRGLQDRTNAGRGYTESQLNEMQVVSNHHYNGRESFEHWDKRAAYLSNRDNWHMEEAESTPVLEPTRHKAAHIAASLQEVEEVRSRVEQYAIKLQDHVASLEADILAHLWVDGRFAEPAADSLTGTQNQVTTLGTRISAVHEGFGLLPRETADEKPAKPTRRSRRKK